MLWLCLEMSVSILHMNNMISTRLVKYCCCFSHPFASNTDEQRTGTDSEEWTVELCSVLVTIILHPSTFLLLFLKTVFWLNVLFNLCLIIFNWEFLILNVLSMNFYFSFNISHFALSRLSWRCIWLSCYIYFRYIYIYDFFDICQNIPLICDFSEADVRGKICSVVLWRTARVCKSNTDDH